MNNPHRNSLKGSSNNVRWPVNLNQLAAISLDDDSDLDRSLTDVSSQDIGSVKLLRMLKDSDDESTSAIVPSNTQMRRPRSVYSGLQQPSQRVSTDLRRSSSQRRVDPKDSSIPKPQHRVPRADLKGLSGSSSSSSLLSQSGTQNRSFSTSSSTVRPPKTRTEQNESGQTVATTPPRTKSAALGIKSSTSMTSSTSSASLIQRPKTLSHSSSGNSLTPRPKTSLPTPSSSLSLASKASGSGSGLAVKQRSSIPATKQETQLANLSNGAPHMDQGPRGTSSPTLISDSPRGGLPTPVARNSIESSQPRPVVKINSNDSQIATAALPTNGVSDPVLSQQVDQQGYSIAQAGASGLDTTAAEEMAAAMISELTEELERWKTEVREYRQERVMVDTWRKQISDLERDLEVALETLQTAEGKVIETKAEKDRDIQTQLMEHQAIIDKLQAEVEKEKLEREKALQEKEHGEQQKVKIEELESLKQDLDRKLSQAQQEIEQLEMQTVPAELQDVHQAHFQATQELEQVKDDNQRLIKELSEEKFKVAQEQEESGNLLVKLSQLQETIANQLRDNNLLKDQLKDHEKCQETAEALEHRHKNGLEHLQKELTTLQQRLTQEREQKSHVEQSHQDCQVHLHQLQQQLQLQQAQLLQQQTEIVSLRAALEVEQKQSTMLLQQQSAAAVSAPHFGRRVSLDGELNGSFLMIETSNAFNNSAGNILASNLGDGSSAMMGTSYSQSAIANASSFNTVGAVSVAAPVTPSNSSFPPLGRNFDNSSHSMAMNAALPPTSAGMSLNPSIPAHASLGGMPSLNQQSGYEVEVKPRMIHRGSSGSITGSVEELTAQLHHLMKEKEKLQADLSKIPLSGGGPMTRRKVEMLEEAMDETERAMGKIRYSLRLRS
ncbi:hypothetical protein BGZ93_003375 [Podila epicladia]|nr:hypothetical protein BGZ93_003375 [Podila epicladia]